MREWLKELPAHERLAIGEDIKAVQFRWPLGMPLVRKLTGKVWEVRTQLPTRIARVLFTVKGKHMVLVHGFIKKRKRHQREVLSPLKTGLISKERQTLCALDANSTTS